tara:strand:+ start:1987 stop:2232 length:246 start_codon:yes stop_codon:yes gene_type:complete
MSVTTKISKSDLAELAELVQEHLVSTGEPVGAFAERAGVNRRFVSQLNNAKDDHLPASSPQLETVGLILKAIGKKIIFVDE